MVATEDQCVINPQTGIVAMSHRHRVGIIVIGKICGGKSTGTETEEILIQGTETECVAKKDRKTEAESLIAEDAGIVQSRCDVVAMRGTSRLSVEWTTIETVGIATSGTIGTGAQAKTAEIGGTGTMTVSRGVAEGV